MRSHDIERISCTISVFLLLYVLDVAVQRSDRLGTFCIPTRVRNKIVLHDISIFCLQINWLL